VSSTKYEEPVSASVSLGTHNWQYVEGNSDHHLVSLGGARSSTTHSGQYETDREVRELTLKANEINTKLLAKLQKKQSHSLDLSTPHTKQSPTCVPLPSALLPAQSLYNASMVSRMSPRMPTDLQTILYISDTMDYSICLNTTSSTDPCVENMALGVDKDGNAKKYATFMLKSKRFQDYFDCDKHANGSWIAPLSCVEKTQSTCGEPIPFGHDYLAAFDPREDALLKTMMENGTVTVPGIKFYVTVKAATDEVIDFTLVNVNDGKLQEMQGKLTYKKLTACFVVVWNRAQDGMLNRGAKCAVKKDYKVTEFRRKNIRKGKIKLKFGSWKTRKHLRNLKGKSSPAMLLHFDVAAAQIV